MNLKIEVIRVRRAGWIIKDNSSKVPAFLQHVARREDHRPIFYWNGDESKSQVFTRISEVEQIVIEIEASY